MSRLNKPDALHTVKAGSFTGYVFTDPDPMSPKDWDNVGTLVTWHRSYCFDVDGSKRFGDPEDFIEQAKAGDWVYLLVGMIDHSGISLYAGGGPAVGDAAGWDSGTVGFIYTTPERYRELMTTDGVLADGWQEQAKETLRAEIETWDQYARGDVYGYEIEDADGNHVDSCWGFYGDEDVLMELKSVLESYADGERAAEELVRNSFRL